MIMALYVIGAITLIMSIISGFLLGSFMKFILSVIGGVASAMIFWALANIIDKQDDIINGLQQLTKGSKTQEKKTCINCNHTYDADYTSCPHCGRRE